MLHLFVLHYIPLAFTFIMGKSSWEISVEKRKIVPTSTIYKLTSHLMYYKIIKNI